MHPRVVKDAPFPTKKILGSTNDATVLKRRVELEQWANQMLQLCTVDNPIMTAGQAQLQQFFQPDDAGDGAAAVAGEGTPRTRAAMARQSLVSLPSRTDDVENAVPAILRMLPKVNRELLATYLDGFAKEGWVYKEGQHHSGWQRRWMVLWPKTPHPK